MIKVGLSGNRFSGKDRIVKLFKQIGIPVFEADIVLKFILNYNTEKLKQLKYLIGDEFFIGDHLDIKSIKREEKFGKVVEHFKEELFNAYKKFNRKNYKSIYSIFHSSILFESDWDFDMDMNISVFTPSNIRIDRCKFETNYKTSEIYKLMKSEMSELDKNNRATYVVHNYEVVDTMKEINKIDSDIINHFLYSEIKITN